MLKLSAKRPFEQQLPPGPLAACSPHRIAFLDSPNKRPRGVSAGDGFGTSPQQYQAQPPPVDREFGAMSMSPTRTSPTRSDSPFGSQPLNMDERMLSYIPRNKRKQVIAMLSQQPQQMMPGQPPSVPEPVFTLSEVREIVQRALEDRENILRSEYDKILQERLTEQFHHFAKFNEDYISRQLKQSQFSYIE